MQTARSSLTADGFIRHFDDGVAVFDPVSWQTHILSREGFEILQELMAMVTGDATDPAALVSSLLVDSPAEQAPEQLLVFAQIACHLHNGEADV